MYQALYNKYRPDSFNNVVGQEVVKKILINSIKNNKISHAYLFSGPRGTGKTSIAKLFAKAVNCLNFTDDVCLECENCKNFKTSSDIIELDAASHNGVDDIRDIISKVQIVPESYKYKVYIIDEVHMLSNSAFNALLKTLEEPPQHVIFVLATTEFYEVPETIVSRCQCFSFQRISNANLYKRLNYICEQENIIIEEKALNEIALFSNGGLRDAISMLDKLASFSNNNIDVDSFMTVNGLISQEDIIFAYNSLIESNSLSILKILNKINDSGYDFSNFVERLMTYTRDQIIDSYTNNTNCDINLNIKIVTKLNDLLNQLKFSLNPMIITQIYILDLLNEKKKNVEPIQIKEVKHNTSFEINKDIEDIRINNTLTKGNKDARDLFTQNWSKIKDYRNTIKYRKVINLLEKITPKIISEDHAILVTNKEDVIFNLYKDINLVEDLIKEINNNVYKLVFINENRYNNIIDKYKSDIKSGITYNLLEEKENIIKDFNVDPEIERVKSIFGEFIEEE